MNWGFLWTFRLVVISRLYSTPIVNFVLFNENFVLLHPHLRLGPQIKTFKHVKSGEFHKTPQFCFVFSGCLDVELEIFEFARPHGGATLQGRSHRC